MIKFIQRQKGGDACRSTCPYPPQPLELTIAPLTFEITMKHVAAFITFGNSILFFLNVFLPAIFIN